MAIHAYAATAYACSPPIEPRPIGRVLVATTIRGDANMVRSPGKRQGLEPVLDGKRPLRACARGSQNANSTYEPCDLGASEFAKVTKNAYSKQAKKGLNEISKITLRGKMAELSKSIFSLPSLLQKSGSIPK